MNKRQFLKNTLYGSLGLSLFSGLYAWQIEPFWVDFVQQDMPLDNLPIDLENNTLIQISDVHIGNRFNYQYIIDVFKKIQQLKPDFVVYTGDYVNYKDTTQIEQLTEVFQFAPLGKKGTFGILGNHDYGKNWAHQDVADNITKVLSNAGIVMLLNEQKNSSGLNFIGFDDYWALNFDPEKALQNYDDKIPTIALCHNPDVCDLDIWQNFKGWILSGHTHGGQVRMPFLDPLIVPVKNKNYTSGVFILDKKRTLYINRALGHLRQIRFNVRPEVTIFTLKKFVDS